MAQVSWSRISNVSQWWWEIAANFSRPWTHPLSKVSNGNDHTLKRERCTGRAESKTVH